MEDPSKWVHTSEKHDSARHFEERMTNGFSEYDWWNFCDYIAWVNIQALEKFKTGHGYPAQLGGMENWVELLDEMIDGFKASLDLSNFNFEGTEEANALVEKMNKGLALYAKHFSSLWD